MEQENNLVLVTGGAGYIGSHCIVELQNAGYDVVAVDNFVNSRSGTKGSAPSLKRVEQITGREVIFYQCDLVDSASVNKIFDMHKFRFVIHFAAVKAVGESMVHPLLYYKNNVIGTINLIEAMKTHSVTQLVFSSSCTVYGNPEFLPITEAHKTGNVTNVYGRTKYMIEEMLKDLAKAEKGWNIISLRYFNPVGAHPSGLIGEDPTKAFTNVMPYIAQVAVGNKPHLSIFGGDYDTPDGTGVRDYIHVMDLAAGHVAALNKLSKTHLHFRAYNLGIGKGVSVLELVKTFEQASGQKIPYEITGRRLGDAETLVCDATFAQEELAWSPRYDIHTMCADMWNWQNKNPNGYQTEVNGHSDVTNGHSVVTNGHDNAPDQPTNFVTSTVH